MNERHKKEVAELQATCPHEHVKVREYVHGWMMHGGDWKDYCVDCGKTIAYYRTPYKLDKNHMPVATGKEERVLTEDLIEWRLNNEILD